MIKKAAVFHLLARGKAILATNDNLEDFDCQDDEVHLGYDEQDEKIGWCVLFTGEATGNYGNLADVNLGKKCRGRRLMILVQIINSPDTS